jgi:hypothetical protein
VPAALSQLQEPLKRACLLGDLRWSTLPFGDGNEIWFCFNGNEKKTAPRRTAFYNGI